jgi:hypothetical protein
MKAVQVPFQQTSLYQNTFTRYWDSLNTSFKTMQIHGHIKHEKHSK